MRRLVMLLALPVAVAAPSASGGQPLPVGAEFQVNTYTTSGQGQPAVSGTADGGFVVVWESAYQDGDGVGVFGQRYASSGAPITGEFQINTYTTSDQIDPAVAGTATGGFVAVWTEFFGPFPFHVHSQRYASDGSPLGAEFEVGTSYSFHPLPAVSGVADGGFVIVWGDFGADGYGIAARRYGSTGAALGGQFVVHTNNTTAFIRGEPDVAGTADGGFVVVWTSYSPDGDAGAVAGRRYASSGAPIGSEFVVNSYTTSSQDTPSVAGTADGGFVVVWESYSQDGSHNGIFGQRYSGSGAPIGGEFQVNTYTTNAQQAVDMTPTGDGGFVVVWSSTLYPAGGFLDFRGQRYASGGIAAGSEFTVNVESSLNPFHIGRPAIAPTAGGGFVAVWHNFTNAPGTDAEDVYAQRFCGVTCTPGDGCCPTGCDFSNDDDCASPIPTLSLFGWLLLAGFLTRAMSCGVRRGQCVDR